MKKMECEVDGHGDDQRFLVGMIEHSPRVCHQLGLLVANFSILEFSLVMIAAYAIGEKDSRRSLAHAICDRLRSYSDRCKLVRDLVDRSSLKQEEKVSLIEIIDNMIALNTERNKYVHGMWEGSRAGHVRLSEYGPSARPKNPVKRAINGDELADFVEIVRRLVLKTADAVGIEHHPV
jgi:hypothetical protein